MFLAMAPSQSAISATIGEQPSERLASGGITGDQLTVAVKPLGTSQQYSIGGFKGDP